MTRTTKIILCFVALLSLLLRTADVQELTADAQDLTAYGIAKEKVLYMRWDMSKESFEVFFMRLRELIKRISKKTSFDRYRLPHPTGVHVPPNFWILIDISCGGGDEASILLRADNLYQVGFRNKNRELFTLANHIDLIPLSKPTKFGDSYGTLTKRNLVPTIPLGKAFGQCSCRNISQFDPASSNEEHMKISLVQNLIMYSETQRFFPIHDKVSTGWEGTSNLDIQETRLLLAWAGISTAKSIWEDWEGDWAPKNIPKAVIEDYNIYSFEVADRIVDVELDTT